MITRPAERVNVKTSGPRCNQLDAISHVILIPQSREKNLGLDLDPSTKGK